MKLNLKKYGALNSVEINGFEIPNVKSYRLIAFDDGTLGLRVDIEFKSDICELAASELPKGEGT